MTLQKTDLKRHKFNIFPEAKPEDFARLRDDIRDNGYQVDNPIVIYEDAILDGWNRYTACRELKVEPSFLQFNGTASDAIALVMRTNKRRNLNSGQWATIAVESEHLIAVIREQVEGKKLAKQKANAANQHTESALAQKIVPTQNKGEKETAHKTAELFNTNRTYVNQAAKIKQAAPDVFEKVKAGRMTMQDATKVVRAIPTEPWLADEGLRKSQLEAGKTCVANAERDKNLIQWAEKKGLVLRVDRSTEWGNPFILDVDGDRDEVCSLYAAMYLPYKRGLIAKAAMHKGKLLVCHCYPQRCHADSIAQLIDS